LYARSRSGSPAIAWSAAARLAVATSRTCREISVPTLLVWGDRDTWFPREEQDRVTAALPGARLAIIEGTGHTLHWERPDTVAEVIADFLRETA
jgi:pimeloyl-ACP methyl ester carboxylesterase